MSSTAANPSSTGTEQLLRVMRQYWGYDEFRPLQRESMLTVLEGRDSVVVLPTGGGKSLCFQAPAISRERGLAVVVSPLISLMKDQVDALTDCGVPAAFVNSTLSHAERKDVADRVRSGQIRLLYVAPERLVQSRTIDFLREANVQFIAVDEAHCISQWGHDFRPEYRALSCLREAFPDISIHAFTATATERVRHDIATALNLREPELVIGSFDRPNLTYRVLRRSDRFSQIREIIDRHRGESGIVYCISRKEVDSLSTTLNELGHRTLPYHAGMDAEARKASQDAFIAENIDTIVATVAFGMGIDKSNVRYVIHAGMPKSLEHYQQEAGRAGRDGLEAECTLIYSMGDYMTWQRIIESNEPTSRASAVASLRVIADYCTGVTCRHRQLVEHFDQPWERAACDACDVCLGDMECVADAQVIAQKLLSSVVRQGQRFGGEYTAMVLKGSQDQRIFKNGHDQLSTYGLLAEYSIKAIRDWTEQLVAQGFLTKVGEYNLLQLTETSRSVLRGETTPTLLQPADQSRERSSSRSGGTEDSWDGVDRDLFDELRALRFRLATRKSVPPYVVFSDAALRDMARRRPTDHAGFHAVKGVGDAKLAEYGDTFIDCIVAYCEANGVEMNVDPRSAAAGAVRSSARPREIRQSSIDAFGFFRQHQSVADVAERLGRAPSTVMGYLADFIKHELIDDPSAWIDADTTRRITEAARECGIERLKPIYEQLDRQIDYDSIRIVVSCLQNAASTAT